MRFQHYGKDTIYKVVAISQDTEDPTKMIISYVLENPQDVKERRIWSQPLLEFFSIKEVDGELVPRFQFLPSEGCEELVPEEDDQPELDLEPILHALLNAAPAEEAVEEE